MVARVDHKIRISLSEIPHDVFNHIVEALSIPNMERQKAMEQRIWGWQEMPETIEVWEHDGSNLIIPRGFAYDLITGLEYLGIELDIEDNRVFEPKFRVGDKIDLFPWQAKALAAMLEAQEGIWKAPAGSGKTVGILELVRRLACRSIVIVNTKDIMWQWQARAKKFLGESYPVGQIGDGVFEPSQYLTIATAQTLHRRFDELERERFFDQFSLLCLDECHHATAETYNKLVNRFSCRYRIGVSATPDKTGDFALATNVIGPVIHETLPDEVTNLMKPMVYKVPTRFNFPYRGPKGRRPSNYQAMLKAMLENDERNELIVNSIMSESGTHSLVLSKRLDHIDTLIERIIQKGYRYQIFSLTGRESSEQRQEIVEIASSTPCVVFSTLADEALDIPRLDRLFLTFPQRNAGLITQQVGRLERKHEEKELAIIYDFCDLNVGPCENQWRVRRLEVYEPRGYKIEIRKPYQ